MDLPLNGLRVIEIADSVAGAYCGKLLADYGAEVIKIEKPGSGDGTRRLGPFLNDIPDSEGSGMFLYLNSNKKGITLALGDPQGRQILGKMCSWANTLILGLAVAEIERLGYQQLLESNKHLTIITLTPYGLTSPYRYYEATELTLQHASGIPYYTPGDVTDPEKEPPVKLAGRQAEMIGGLSGAFTAILASLQTDATGKGNLVDIALIAAPLLSNIWNLGLISYTGKLPKRGQIKTPIQPQQIMPCKDGFIQLSCNEERHWKNFLDVIGNPGWASDARFADGFLRGKNWEVLEPLLTDTLKDWSKQDITEKAQTAGVPCTIVATPSDLMNDAQMLSRNFYVNTPHQKMERFLCPGSPFSSTEIKLGKVQAAPRLGQHNKEIFCDKLGYSRKQLRLFYQNNII